MYLLPRWYDGVHHTIYGHSWQDQTSIQLRQAEVAFPQSLEKKPTWYNRVQSALKIPIGKYYLGGALLWQ